MAKVVFGVDIQTGEAITNIAQLEDHLTALKEKIRNVDAGSAEFKKLQGEIVTADSKMKNLNKSLEGADTEKLAGAFAKLGEGVAGGFAVAQSALALFGQESEDVAAAQAKAQQAIAIVLGARSIAEAALNVQIVANTVATKANAIATAIMSKVQKILTGEIKLSSLALKGFKAALAATGIGAIVILLGELIFNFDEVNKYISRAINWIRDFADRVSGGNKIVKGLVEVLILVGSPLVTIIRLINDFSGTLSQFQNGINGAVESVAQFADRFGKLGDLLRAQLQVFNFVINGLKSLDSSANKFKPSLEGLTKVYEVHNQAIEKNKAAIDSQIRVAQAQGASEEKLAALTIQSLKATIEQRKIAADQAEEIAARLIQQNGKLTDDQQKLYDQVTGDFKKSQEDLLVFEEQQATERRKKANDAYKKLLEDQKAALDALKDIIKKTNQEIEDIEDASDEEKLLRAKQRAEEEILLEYEKTNKKAEAQALRDQALLGLEDKYQLELKALQDAAQKERENAQIEAQTETFEKIQTLQAQHEQAIADLKALQIAQDGITLEEQLELNKDALNRELEQLQEKADAELLIEQEKLEKGLITKQQFDEFNAEQLETTLANEELIKETYRQKDIEASKAAEEKKKSDRKALLDQSLQLGAQFIGALTKLNEAATNAELEAAGDNEEAKEKIRKEAFERQKALNIVMAVINTAQAVVAALNAPPPLSFISAGIAGAVGAIEIATIASQTYQGSSSGGAGGGGGVPAIPSVSGAGQNFDPSLVGQAGGGAGSNTQQAVDNANQPVKVYVVESEITNTQNKVAAIEAKSKFG